MFLSMTYFFAFAIGEFFVKALPFQLVDVVAAGHRRAQAKGSNRSRRDAQLLRPEFFPAAATRAGLRILANLGDLNAAFPQTLIMMRRSYLAGKRETVKSFIRAPWRRYFRSSMLSSKV
jgi:hypothetical protein